MKIQILTSNLQKKLSIVNRAISSKSQLPVLQNILLETKNGKLTLSSTDLEIGLTTNIPSEVLEEGKITVPAKLFSELLSSLPEETILLEAVEQKLKIKTGKTNSVIQTGNSDDFPLLYEEKGELIAKIDTKDLKEGFLSVVFAASPDTSRPALSGVYIKKETEGFLLVATDGYRLSLKHHKLNSSPAKSLDDINLLVPSRVLRELIAIKEDPGVIDMYLAPGNNQILFEQEGTVLVGRLIEAVYPNYQKIIPSDHSASIVFDREELLKAVKICSIFAREAANIIKLSLKKDRLVVSSESPQIGENTVDVPARLTGEENEIAFNARYLLDVLANLTAEELVFEMTGPLNPGVFKIKDDASYLHLIMPIRLQG